MIQSEICPHGRDKCAPDFAQQQTRCALERVFGEQFDLEIALKTRELEVIQSELEVGRHWLHRSMDGEEIPPRKRAREEYSITATALDSFGERGISVGVFARSRTGLFVRLVCPVCQRTDFSTRSGFVNHCREAHTLVFASVDACIEQCGLPVPESLVPSHDPCRWQTQCFNPNRELDDVDELSLLGGETLSITPTIKVFNMDAASTTDTNTAGEPTITAMDGTRFHFKKRLRVGNISMLLPKDHSQRKRLNATHKWMVYLQSADQAQEDITIFVARIRFFLHPSYRPNDFVQLERPPFQLMRYGWGEFPIRVQIEFHCPHWNRSVNVIHCLTLDSGRPGEQVQGAEHVFEVELDRRTKRAPSLSFDSFEISSSETGTDSSETDEYCISSSGDDQQHHQSEWKPPLLYCRYCGSTEDQHFDRKTCPFRPPARLQGKPTTMTTLSRVATLFQKVLEPTEPCAVRGNSIRLDLDPLALRASLCERLVNANQPYWTPPGRCLEFVRRVVLQLVPSHLSLRSLQRLQVDRGLYWSEANRGSSTRLEGEAESLTVLYLAMRIFLCKLLQKSVDVHRAEQLAIEKRREPVEKAERPTKLLTPYHVFRAIYQERFTGWDFLTNDYMEAVTDTEEEEEERELSSREDVHVLNE